MCTSQSNERRELYACGMYPRGKWQSEESGWHLAQKEPGLAHDIKEGRASVKQRSVSPAQEHEGPLLGWLLGASHRSFQVAASCFCHQLQARAHACMP